MIDERVEIFLCDSQRREFGVPLSVDASFGGAKLARDHTSLTTFLSTATARRLNVLRAALDDADATSGPRLDGLHPRALRSRHHPVEDLACHTLGWLEGAYTF